MQCCECSRSWCWCLGLDLGSLGIGVDHWVEKERWEGKEKSRALKMKAGSLCLVWGRQGKLERCEAEGDLSKVRGWKDNPSSWVWNGCELGKTARAKAREGDVAGIINFWNVYTSFNISVLKIADMFARYFLFRGKEPYFLTAVEVGITSWAEAKSFYGMLGWTETRVCKLDVT